MQIESMLNLKWDSFSSQLTRSLDTCYENSHFVDLTLVCKNGATIKCHKIILANASSFFRSLLVRNDHPHPMIILHDIEASDLKIIINFMYCGEIKVAQSEVKRILKIAEILQVSGLKDMRSTILSTTEVTPRIIEKPIISGKKNSLNNSIDLSTLQYRKNTKKHEKREQLFDAHAYTAPHTQTQIMADPHAPIMSDAHAQIMPDPHEQISEAHAQIASEVRIRRYSESTPKKRRRNHLNNDEITWTKVLSQISRETATPLKRLCVMDEVEIRPSKHKSIQLTQPITDHYSNAENSMPSVEPLNIESVLIKHEIIDIDDYYDDNWTTGNGQNTGDTTSPTNSLLQFGDSESGWEKRL